MTIYDQAEVIRTWELPLLLYYILIWMMYDSSRNLDEKTIFLAKSILYISPGLLLHLDVTTCNGVGHHLMVNVCMFMTRIYCNKAVVIAFIADRRSLVEVAVIDFAKGLFFLVLTQSMMFFLA